MARKYGLLVFDYISIYQDVFDIISVPWDNVMIWPTESPIKVTDKEGQVQYQWTKNVFFKIVEDHSWGTDQNNAVNTAVSEWNTNNPSNSIPEGFKVVFTENEAKNIPNIFEEERQRLIDG